MPELDEEQRKWLVGLGANQKVVGAPYKVNMDPLGLRTPEGRAAIGKSLEESDAKATQEAEQMLAKVTQALAEVKSGIEQMPSPELNQSSYIALMKSARERYPELANLAQWVKHTSANVTGMKGRLPKPNELMNVIEAAVHKRSGEALWAMGSGTDFSKINTDRLLAAYAGQLPSGIDVALGKSGLVQLTVTGAALAVQAAGGEAEASAGKGGTAVTFKNNDLAIEVKNDGWKGFDPQVRGQWSKIDDGARTVLKLKASRDNAKLELESAKKSGKVDASLQVKFDKAEAEFDLAWKSLQEQITATAKASREKLSASVAYLQKNKDDKETARVGAEASVDLKTLEGELETYFKNPDVEAVLKVTAAAEKVAASLEVTAVKSGVVVTANFEKALDETKVEIEALINKGHTKVAAELKKEAEKLSAKIKVVHDTKNLKLAAELETTLKEIRGKVEVEAKAGPADIKVAAEGSSSGEVSGKVQIDIALEKGRAFVGGSDKLSFAATVSNTGYKVELVFSVGEPVETPSLQEVFGTAEKQIKELYQLAGDKGIRSIQDVAKLNEKMQAVMAPLDAAAKKAKTLKDKKAISASFGISVQGDWPTGGKAAPPVVAAGVTFRF